MNAKEARKNVEVYQEPTTYEETLEVIRVYSELGFENYNTRFSCKKKAKAVLKKIKALGFAVWGPGEDGLVEISW